MLKQKDMKKLLAFFTIILSCINLQPQENYKYAFERMSARVISTSIAIDDINNDGTDEIIILDDDDIRHYVLIHDYSFYPFPQKYLWHVSENVERINFSLHNLNGDNNKEFIYTYKKSDTLYLEIRNREQILQNKFPVVISKGKYESVLCTINAFISSEKGSSPCVLIFLTSKENLCLRELISCNLETGEILWKLPVTGHMMNFKVYEDIMFFNTSAPGNGCKVGEYADDFSYIYAVGKNGKPEWIKKIGIRNSDVRLELHDTGNNGDKEIIYIEQGGSTDYPRERRALGILGFKTGDEIKKIFIDGCLHDLAVKTDDKNLQIIVTKQNSKELLLFDRNLTLQTSIESDMIEPEIEVCDIDYNGKSELILYSKNSRELCVLDHKLNQITPVMENVDRYFIIKNEPIRGKFFVLLSAFYPDKYMMETYTVKKSFVLNSFYLVSIGLAAGIIISLAAVGVIQNRRKKKNRINKETIVQWAVMAQKLTHYLKNPLSTINLTAQRLQMEFNDDDVQKKEIYNRYIDSIIDEIDKLNKMSTDFMRFANVDELQLHETGIVYLLKQFVENYSHKIPKDIKIRMDAEENLPSIRVDQRQLEMALTCIVENAVNAIKDKGIISISLFKAQKLQRDTVKEFIIIEIRDTGSGIPFEKLKEIFNPFFTIRQNGTGLGLTIAKRIIENHNGTISIDSKVGTGTTVTIEMPV